MITIVRFRSASSALRQELSQLEEASVGLHLGGARWLLCLTGLLISVFAIAAANVQSQPPNILIITADNLGYGDLPCYNAESSIKTPNLDRLAEQGARLTSFYTASSTCTVSRACLLTGRVAQRHGLVNQLPGVKGNYGVGLNPRETLIPQLLKSAPTPYATGCFGKWNIGFAKGSRPTERGFDEFIGHASGNLDYYHHNYREMHDLYRGVEPLHREGEYSTDLFADSAIEFISRHRVIKKPWFCYLPFNAPHFPMKGNKRPGQPNVWQAPDWAFEGCGLQPDESDPRKRYEVVVFALDRAIGRVLDALDQAGVAENTFVFFMSDNGAFDLNRQGLDVGSNHPLRSGGITCWEGGIRVAAMARWPGKIPPGSVMDQPLWSPDLLVACTTLAAAALPDGLIVDGKNPLPVLTDNADSPHDSMYFSFRSHAALRKGDWKIVREKPDQPWHLYNLAHDLQESRNLANEYPQRVDELDRLFASWLDTSASADGGDAPLVATDAAQSSPATTFLNFIKTSASAMRSGDRVPTSLDDWNRQRDQIRNHLLDAWGGFPESPTPLDPQTLGTLKRDGYRIEKIIFQTLPDVRMTANAYVPDRAGKLPAVLCVHGHWRGAKQDPNVQARCIGLAKLGFFVLAVDAFGAGERGVGKPLGEYHGEMVAATLWPIGRPLSGLQVYENQRAIDYLITRPEVDADRIGVTGASGGGNQTMYIGAWDGRLKAVVPVCSVGNYQAYLGAACCMCEVVPGALDFTEEWGVLALSAPRALMVISATRDAFQFSVGEARKSLARVKPVYQLFGVPCNMRHAIFESPHAYNQPMREAMYGWMTLHLKGEGDGTPIAEPRFDTEDPETLRCYPNNTRPDDYLTIPKFAAREAKQWVDAIALPADLESWKSASSDMRTRLEKQVLGGTTPRPEVKLIDGPGTSPVTSFTFEPEPGIELSATETIGKGPQQQGTVILLSLDGEQGPLDNELAMAIHQSGRKLVSLNLRATGNRAYGRDKVGRAPDHNTAEWSLWLGRPLLGQWVRDVRTLIDLIGQRPDERNPLTVVGIGPAGVVAICAAGLDTRITDVVTVGSLASYLSDLPYENQRLGIMAPGMVRDVGDMQHVAALIAPRKLSIHGAVSGAGPRLDSPVLEKQFEFTNHVYALHDASAAFSFTPDVDHDQIVQGLTKSNASDR